MNVYDNVALASDQMLLTFTVILFVCSKVQKEVKIRKCECRCVWNHPLNKYIALFSKSVLEELVLLRVGCGGVCTSERGRC